MKKIKKNNPLARYCWALILACTVWLAPASANNTLELSIIPLQHRPAASLIPSLSHLVQHPATITAAGNQLLLRADKSTSAQLRLLIDELDKPLRQFLIEVRQGMKSGLQTRHLQGDVQRSSVHSGSTDHSTTSSLVVRRSTGSKGGASLQSIKALEGYPAYIETGTEIPFWSFNRGGEAGQTYKAINTGFYATLLSSNDERFVMQLSAQQQDTKNNSKTLQVDRAQSTLSGRLGEWTAVGSNHITKKNNNRTLNTKTSHSSDRQQILYLRVSETH